MKILVIAGDYWHPMEVIKRGIEYLHLNPKQYEFDFVEDAKDIVTKEFLMEQDLVIFAKSNVIGSWNPTLMFEEENAALTVADYRSYVEKGGAFLCLHAGNTVAQKVSHEWYDFIGNYFVTHPARCEVHVSTTGCHVLAKQFAEFTEIDEHYILGEIARDAEVFLKSDSLEGGIQAAGYTRRLGLGKVCVLTPGHTMNVWRNPSFKKIFKEIVDWCAE